MPAATASKPVKSHRPGMPYENSKLAVYLRKVIDSAANEKSQRELAFEIGYDKPNMISMFKRGETKLPLDKVPALARALNVDAAHLFRLTMEQQAPKLAPVIAEIFGSIISKNESDWISAIRQASGNTDPVITPDQKKDLIKLIKGR